MNYPRIYNNDIKVLGRVVSIASENKVAAAEQIFDEDFKYNDLATYSFDNANIDPTKEGMDQYSINRLIGKKVKTMENAGLVPDAEGYLNNIKINHLTVKGGANFDGDVTFGDNVTINKNLTVGDTITTKKLNVTEQANIKKLILNDSVNVGDFIIRINKIVDGTDKDNAIWEAINSLRADLNRLRSEFEECCAEVKNMIANIPTGGGGVDLRVDPSSLNMTVGDTATLSVYSNPQLAGSYTITSNNSGVASVSGNTVTAVAPGTTSLTVDWRGVTKTVPVTVVSKDWTVTFDPANGSASTSTTVKDGETVSRPTNPTRSGYTFDYWMLSGSQYDFNAPVHENITLVGHWTEEVVIENVTVTFDSNGGSAVASQTIQSGSTATRPTDPTYTGKLFGGWYLGNDQFSFSTPITSNITLVAHWVDEAVAPSSIVITGLDRIPTGEKTTYSAQIVPSNASVDTEITWSVASGEGSINASTGEYTAPGTAQEVEIKATAANGVSQTKRVEIYVTEVPVEYVTVTFDTDGGTPAIADQRIEKGTKATQPSAPIKQGHTFLEWRMVNAGNGFEAGHVWDFSDNVTEDIALKAFYNENAPDPVPVSSMTIFGPSEVMVSTKNENEVSNAYTVQFNDGANTGTAVTWSIDDDVPAGSDQATRLENKGQISGTLGTTEAIYISPYHDVDSVTIRVTSENGTTATKTIKVTGEPQPDPTYTISWTCTYLGESGAGYCSIKGSATGSEEVQAGQNWGPATFLIPSRSGYTLTDNGVDIKEASAGNGITINNVNENHEILLNVTVAPIWVTVSGEHAQVMDYGINGGTWLDLDADTSRSFDKTTSGMGDYIYPGSSVSYSIRPTDGYKITGVSFQYDGDAADDDGLTGTTGEIDNGSSGQFYINNIKSSVTVTIITSDATVEPQPAETHTISWNDGEMHDMSTEIENGGSLEAGSSWTAVFNPEDNEHVSAVLRTPNGSSFLQGVTIEKHQFDNEWDISIPNLDADITFNVQRPGYTVTYQYNTEASNGERIISMDGENVSTGWNSFSTNWMTHSNWESYMEDKTHTFTIADGYEFTGIEFEEGDITVNYTISDDGKTLTIDLSNIKHGPTIKLLYKTA